MSIITVFLQAISVGAVQVRHGAVLLAHYGRLGSTYDTCVKALIEVLRSEGLFNENGKLVAEVIIQAMREVSRNQDRPEVIVINSALTPFSVSPLHWLSMVWFAPKHTALLWLKLFLAALSCVVRSSPLSSAFPATTSSRSTRACSLGSGSALLRTKPTRTKKPAIPQSRSSECLFRSFHLWKAGTLCECGS